MDDDWARIVEALAAPFDPADVKWRVGSTNKDKTRGMALAYMDARLVMQRLDEVVGPFNWQSRIELGEQGKVAASIGIRGPGNDWVWKSDGAGETDFEGDKGSISDALKRAAVHWGIGRYLYAVEAPWVEITARGKSYAIEEHERDRLASMLKAKERAASHSGGEPGGGDPVPPAPSTSRAPREERTRTGFITKPDQKKLYSANFRAHKAIGRTDAQIDALSAEKKFEPINFAVAHIGHNRLEDLYENQVSDAIAAMHEWVKRENRKAEGKTAASDHPDAEHPDPGHDADDHYSPDVHDL